MISYSVTWEIPKKEQLHRLVGRFKERMFDRLLQNNNKRPWYLTQTEFLEGRLHGKVSDLLHTKVESTKDLEEYTNTAVDIANYAMMLADKARMVYYNGFDMAASIDELSQRTTGEKAKHTSAHGAD